MIRPEDGDPATGSDLIDAFRRTVREHRHRPAIIHNGSTIDYGCLDTLVGSTARALGSAPDAVGVFVSHAPSAVVGLLGTLAAGGTYVPIDPEYPLARQRDMIAAAGIGTVLAAAPIPAAPPGVRALVMDAFPAADSQPGADPQPGAWQLPTIEPGRPAYTLFTSGSTGVPKPVITSRAAISITVDSLRELFGLRATDRVLQFASLSWDTCFEEILPALTSGAALVFDDEAYTGSFRRFLRAIEAASVTVLDLPTAYWHELVRHLCDDGAALPPCVRLMIIGGEAANPARVADWYRIGHAGTTLLNTYGCTETTLITHAIDLAGHDGGPVPIGRALPHVRERISDSGELLIGGPAIALGYRGRPEATRERFIELADGRYFRTGDRVSRRSDDLLMHEGRLDHAVKVRGVRVDPGEVESRLAEHPSVTAAAVTGVTLAGRTALVGYVVADGSDDLLAWLRDRVPAHLVPSRLTIVPELVQTTSGKTDRVGTHRRYAQEAPR